MLDVKQAIKDIVEARNIIQSKQSDLRKFVVNIQNPKQERFDVWSKYCEKNHEDWIIGESKYPIIGKIVRKCFPWDYDRYAHYEWNFFVEVAEDDLCEENRYFKSQKDIDDLKEELIQTNFGSFVMDW